MASVETIFNHVVLPPQLPGRQDEELDAIGQDLVQRLLAACRALESTTDPALADGWHALNNLWTSCQKINSETLDNLSLSEAFADLETDKQVLVCYVVEQNAGLLIHRAKDSENNSIVIFEAFEASPLSQDVLAAPNALRWGFPSRAVHVPAAHFDDTNFQAALASILDKASSEKLSHLAARATKAGTPIAENRNPASPALVTDMLFSVLEALGGPQTVQILHKRVRDDVHFHKAGVPWRRLPLWLVLRVAVQRQLSLVHGDAVGYVAYKLLISTLLSQLLDDCVRDGMHPSSVVLLQKKLGRRIAKLEKWTADQLSSTSNGVLVDQLFSNTAPAFQRAIQTASNYVEAEFARFRDKTTRRIPWLPQRAETEDLRLSLPNSGNYLRTLLQKWNNSRTDPVAGLQDQNCHIDLSQESGIRDTTDYVQSIVTAQQKLRDCEVMAEESWSIDPARLPSNKAEFVFLGIAGAISSLTDLALSAAFRNNPGQNSVVLLTIFDLWARLDSMTVHSHPMLAEYRPLFSSDLLQVLQLPELHSMKRLRRIQSYISEREANSKFPDRTIFNSNLDSECFGARFVGTSQELTARHERIKRRQESDRQVTTKNWKEACRVYDEMSEAISSSKCKCTMNKDGSKNINGCVRCFKWRTRNRMSIEVSEDLLPNDEALAAAIVFELDVPERIAIYRSTTWRILRKLAYPKLPPKGQGTLLKNHKPLAKFQNIDGPYTAVSLASSVKSFKQTHYGSQKMKAQLSQLLLPLASDFQLFDTEAGIWIKNFSEQPTLAHLCGVYVPTFLRTTVLPAKAHPPVWPEGPSSYQAVANRPECPLGMSIHEFEAVQRILSGKARRWLTMLAELNCSNLNFSNEDTVVTLSHLAYQVGPPSVTTQGEKYQPSPNHGVDLEHQNALGVCHAVFSDAAFVDRLLLEIEKRLRSIQNNWRETVTMELLITLAQRAYVLSADEAPRRDALALLHAARSTTLGWIDVLREQLMAATDSAAAHRVSMYAFKAALLCRRTFDTLVGEGDDSMGAEDLSAFVRASVALQQNFVVGVEALPAFEKIMLHRDTVMANSLQGRLRNAIERYPECLSEAIRYGIGMVNSSDLKSGSGGDRPGELHFAPWLFREPGNSGWVTSSAPLEGEESNWAHQRVAFHYVSGHILIDGKTMGKLPQDIRDSDDVKELFPSQHLLSYPSSLPGMSHRLMSLVENQSIHFGRREGRVVIVTRRWSGEICEHVPRRIFDNESGEFDLPRGLLDNVVHWFNKTTGQLEFRKGSKWTARPNDWRLDIVSQQAQRNEVLLVDPDSPTFRRLAAVFHQFEDKRRLTVFQPKSATGSLSVELRHLDLSFFVNGHGYLECRELNAEVDPNQDAGTLYGYRSMIVLRAVGEIRRRSIIFPLGPLRWTCDGAHVAAWTDLNVDRHSVRSGAAKNQITPEKSYARFAIDSVLGRLACPPEPRLLYTKALLHAVTSNALPDSLTGRTGEEEANHTLLSGRCQPWTSISGPVLKILEQLAALAPQRHYYPKDKRTLQTVTWDPQAPKGLQNDRYGRLVRALSAKSANLGCFEDPTTALGSEADKTKPPATDDTDRTLELRGEAQRLRYECPQEECHSSLVVENKDVVYVPRGSMGTLQPPPTQGTSHVSSKACAVFRIAQMVLNNSETIPMSKDLSEIFHKWALIGGFCDPCNVETTPISAFMDARTTSEQWGSLVQFFRNASGHRRYDALFTLAQLAFSPNADMDAVHLLAAYCYVPKLAALQPPPHASFVGFSFNKGFTMKELEDNIAAAYKDYQYKHEHKDWATAVSEDEKRQAEHKALCQQDGHMLATALYQCWPEALATDFTSDVVDVPAALAGILPEWNRRSQNLDLSKYVSEVHNVISAYRIRPEKKEREPRGFSHAELAKYFVPAPQQVIPSLVGGLVRSPMAPYSEVVDASPKDVNPTAPTGPMGDRVVCLTSVNDKRNAFNLYSREILELRQIVACFSGCEESLRRSYGEDLIESVEALERLSEQQNQIESGSSTPEPTLANVLARITRAAQTLDSIQEHLTRALSEQGWKGNTPGTAATNGFDWLQRVGLWPRLTRVSLLECLRSTANCHYGLNVREMLVLYGNAIASFQRLERIRRALRKNDRRRVSEEWRNSGHENWNPVDYPDWLLLEIDGDLLIRAEQVDVAQAIIAPETNANSVMQLNMGKGKTSVIVPMVLAVLANTKQLARLIVPKSLLLPTAQVAQSRLGGLVGRELRHVPFSRRLTAASNGAELISIFKEHHEDLMSRSGVLLAAPEHILAFKLSGLQCLVDEKRDVARNMIEFQTQLVETMCRDVLDESDFTLAVQTQLVYPSGQLTAVDGAPHRWQLAQSLLALVEDNLRRLSAMFPHSIQFLQRPGNAFPMVYILNADIQDELRRCISRDISNGRVPFFRPSPDVASRQGAKKPRPSPAKIKHLMERALSDEASDNDIAAAAELFPDAQSVANGLTLVRGLLANGVLLTCLKKRWNVQYGLHPGRWPIAVPFEAKGVPSERSEFGHPDVAIFFTCLSFYYAGLDMRQFRQGLQRVLLHSDDPTTEYEQWMASSGAAQLPEELQHWTAINVDDESQVETLWMNLRFTRPVVNYYLNTFVFPVHARQFSVKLQASAWDLPLFTPETAAGDKGRSRGARTTGFSGTNDNKMMLPLTIKQEDLPSLRQTNAEVLTYLLQERNRQYVCAGQHGRRWLENDLLKSLQARKLRVLIDAGAFILEKNNEGLVRAWLQVDVHRPAAVYFDEKDNRAWVVFRDATVPKAPLVTTPFVDRLDECLVYFDEAHTRGVDLQLPAGAKGALTLGLGQTKDHTVQAAMRLRQLGSTQSLIFYAPPEVDQSIRDVCSEYSDEAPVALSSPHVITWLLEQTCKFNEQLCSLYASHGLDFCQRTDAQWKYKKCFLNTNARHSLLRVLERPERQSLAQLYGGRQAHTSSASEAFVLPEIQAFATTLHGQRRLEGASHRDGGANAGSAFAFEEIEQEREVEVQVEEIRVKQQRPKFSAMRFPGKVGDAICRFVRTGVLAGAQGYEQAFANIARTHLGRRYGVHETGSRLFVSEEFGNTIVKPALGRHPHDDFLRPVEWLLWSPSTETGLIIIPEELELLIPSLRASTHVHLVVYAAPVTRAMADFSRLNFYAFPALPKTYHMPTWLPIELGIVAGRLYMSFEESTHMAAYLARARGDAHGGGGTSFCGDPVGFLLEWLPLRRAAQDVMQTPAAYVCQGRPLRKDHPFFVRCGAGSPIRPTPPDEQSDQGGPKTASTTVGHSSTDSVEPSMQNLTLDSGKAGMDGSGTDGKGGEQ
ncbi:hypothetical protein SPI_06011 [Niveomyces insectorum RCEF 264]|uniref:ubiquitinyl hydrolase 1 n=1 Tax=Niveomyces insectorum RCEF 264 TaxID=1081102 RepID=A0A167SPP3_9HYPO|nr:hypothetical protein SPI_06011 [Niveomyces insectorum RCEF 264]